MGREDYKSTISNAVNDSPKYKLKRTYSYQKNDPNNYEIMTKYGDQTMAIRFAESLEANYACIKYHSHNPYTAVYKLVRQLIGEDEEFNAMILESMGR